MQLELGLSLRGAAEYLQVCPLMLSRWLRDREKFAALSKRWTKKKALVDGPTSVPYVVKEPLLKWVFELHKRGHAVDRSLVLTKACVLLPSF